MATISELMVYPVKSCGGISVTEARLTPTGLPWDRRWMVVDAESGRAVTQRTVPKMAQIKASLPTEAFTADAPPPGGALSLSASGAGGVSVPLAIEGPPQLRQAAVWEWKGQAHDEGDSAAAWLSDFLGRPVRLVRYLGTLDPSSADAAAALAAGAVVAGGGAAGAEAAGATLARGVDAEFVPQGGEVAFADGFPVLVACAESLQDLNGRMASPVPMDRFRANIILSGGGAPFADDGWGHIRLGGGSGGAAGGGVGGVGVEVALVKPCSRCTVPLVDQATGEVAGKEPIKTMQGFRSGRVLGWQKRLGGAGATFFGSNGHPLGSGLVRVGDAVSVLKPTSWVAAA